MSGGIAVVGDVVEAYSMPPTYRGILDLLLGLKERLGGIEFALLETIKSLPAAVERKINEERAQKGQEPIYLGAMQAKLNQSYGAIKMALIAAEIPTDEMRPADWMKLLSCQTKGKKSVTYQKAQQLFPSVYRYADGALKPVSVTLATADALLLAELARRLRTGQIASRVREVRKTQPREGERKLGEDGLQGSLWMQEWSGGQK